MNALEHDRNVPLTEPALPRQRIIRIVATLLAIAIVLALLQLVGVDLLGWGRALSRAAGKIPTPYIVAGIATQTINMMLVGLAYVAVWRAAYPGAKKLPIMQIVTCFVVGTALNGVLPMNMGSFVMAFMFLAIIPGATAAGVASGFGVHQIFFVVAGVVTYGFLFWTISGALNETIGGISNHLPALMLILIGLVIGVVVLLKAFKQKAIDAMENLKQGAAILQTPWRYLVGVLLLQVTAYGFELLTSFIFMRGYGIPATISAVLLNTASNSIATLTAVTPGGVGTSQALTTVALKGIADPATIVAYSLTQQLTLTAWNCVFAALLVVVFFGYKGGKSIVTNSLVQARSEFKEKRAASKQAKAEQKAAKQIADRSDDAST